MLVDPLIRAHRRGPGDPTHRRLGPGNWLRATLTPEGPVLLRIAGAGCAVSARAWGPGADWALDQLPRLLGVDDDPTSFEPRPEHAALVLAHRRHGDVRVGRTERVWESVAPACLEQVVTGKEAFRAYRLLVTRVRRAGAGADLGSGLGGVRDAGAATAPKCGRGSRPGGSWRPGSSNGAIGRW